MSGIKLNHVKWRTRDKRFNGSGPAAILTDVSEVSTDICYMIAENKNWIHFMYNFNDLI